MGAVDAVAQAMTGADGPFDVSALFPLREQIAEMPGLEPYIARDGAMLQFRRYPAASRVHLLLIHGSSSHSAYYHAFAKSLAAQNVATVYALDLRGHGPNPQRRGDIDYPGQLEDDLADLLSHVRAQSPDAEQMIVGGHSSGGGLALRFAGGRYRDSIDGVLLLAPYLGHKAPMVKRNAGGWARPNIPRIIGLSLLSGLGITAFNGAKVLRFNLPAKYHSGHETLAYSFRLMKGMHPTSYATALAKTQARLLLLVGAGDEALRADEFKQDILQYKPDAQILSIAGTTHLGIIMSEAAMAATADWIRQA